MNDYQPVSCDLHSQLELLAMHKTPVSIDLKDSNHSLIGVIVDFIIHDGAEYLILDSGEEARLDTILSVTELKK